MKKFNISISCGVFDMFHNGHKDLIELLKDNGKKVIVFLHDDYSVYLNKEKFPVQNYEQRRKNLSHFTNLIIKCQLSTPADQFIKFFKSNKEKKIVYVRGDDWKDFPGKGIIDINKVPIIYKKYKKGISSTKLREQL